MKEDKFKDIEDMDFTEIEGYYDEDEFEIDLDDYNTSTYQDEYSPGDDYETDWINSLE